MIQKIFNILLLSVVIFSSCKKEETIIKNESNISTAPKDITQSFNIDITVESKKVVEIIKRNGVTEFSKTTFKYTKDTIFETLYELGRRSFLRKHRLDAEVITSSLDSAFGRDTTIYYRFINYEYEGAKIRTKVITHNDILDLITKTTKIRHDYLYKGQNLFETSYDAPNNFDTSQCNDRYEFNSFSTILDVKNILGINQGSANENLISKSTHLINCNGNGSSGSSNFKYWYELNSDKRITVLIYQKTFNGVAQTFRENYKYILR